MLRKGKPFRTAGRRSRYMNAIATLLRKDLLVEYRSRDTFATTLFFDLLFNYSPDANTIRLAVVIVLVAAGYSSLGVLFSTMALGLKNREVLLSVILFPILLPLLIMAVKSSVILLNHLPLLQFYLWL